MIYDPERLLWRPGRRSFLFMFGAAILAPSLPDVVTQEQVLPATGYLVNLYDYAISVKIPIMFMDTQEVVHCAGWDSVGPIIRLGPPPFNSGTDPLPTASGRRLPSPRAGTAPTGLL